MTAVFGYLAVHVSKGLITITKLEREGLANSMERQNLCFPPKSFLEQLPEACFPLPYSWGAEHVLVFRVKNAWHQGWEDQKWSMNQKLDFVIRRVVVKHWVYFSQWAPIVKLGLTFILFRFEPVLG